jgi:hypothetical protein
MSKLFFAVILAIQAHFAASYLVPLDEQAQGTFGGLLRWAWPWSDGDSGPLGTVSSTEGFPLVGFFIAVSAAGLLILAAMAVVGIWVPFDWWRVLTIAGAALSIVLLVLFLGFTKLIPIALAIFILWSVVTEWVATGWSTAPGG